MLITRSSTLVHTQIGIMVRPMMQFHYWCHHIKPVWSQSVTPVYVLSVSGVHGITCFTSVSQLGEEARKFYSLRALTSFLSYSVSGVCRNRPTEFLTEHFLGCAIKRLSPCTHVPLWIALGFRTFTIKYVATTVTVEEQKIPTHIFGQYRPLLHGASN